MTTDTGPSGRPPGIREVARLAGVSVATASLALNSRPGVAEVTRLRVHDAARRLGYQANLQARALRQGISTAYGIVVRNFANPFFLGVLAGAQQAAEQAGATLVVLDSRYSVDYERRHVRELAAQRVAGLAIAPVGAGGSIMLWRQLRPGAPVVALNAEAADVPEVTRVGPDNAAAVELPMRRLAALGHQRVALLAAPRSLMADPDRLRHFLRLAAELGIQPCVMHSPLTIADVQRAATRLLAAPGRPTAVITNSDYTAHGVYKAARDLGVSVGAGISVIGHDDLPTSELLDPPLATIRVDQQALGRALMGRLLGRGSGGDYQAPVALIERASLQAPSRARR